MSYGRSIVLRIGDREIVSRGGGDLRVHFDVRRDKSRDPNDATIQIWNLAATTRAEFEKRARLFCELRAGYEDESIHRVFSGVLLDVVTTYEGPDVITTCTLGDDAAKLAAAVARLHRTFPTGTPVGAVLRELVKATGLGPGNLPQFEQQARLNKSQTLQRPWSTNGSALQELHTFARSLGWQYTIQDQSVQFLGVEPPSGSGALITSQNAQTPTRDAEGTISFTCRLIPELIPGSPVRLDMRDIKGDFAVIQTRHYGDTHSGDFAIDVQADPFSRIISKGLRVNA